MSALPESSQPREQPPLFQAGMILHTLLESPSPVDGWEGQLDIAESHIRASMETSYVPKRYRAELLLIASPLFAIHALRRTCTKPELNARYSTVQQGYISIIHRIDRTIRNDRQSPMVGDLVGLANEAVFLAAATAPAHAMPSDSLLLPALPWQDDVSRPTPRGLGIHTRTPSIDLASVDLRDSYRRYFQVKSSRRSSKIDDTHLSQYKKHDIPILYCDRIMKMITGINSTHLFSVATTKNRLARTKHFAAICDILDETYPVTTASAPQHNFTVRLGSFLKPAGES